MSDFRDQSQLREIPMQYEVGLPPGLQEPAKQQAPTAAAPRLAEIPYQTIAEAPPAAMEDRRSNLMELLDEAGYPGEEGTARVGVAMYLSEHMNMEPRFVWNNLDHAIEEYYGSKVPARTALQYIGDSWKRGQISLESNMILAESLADAARGTFNEEAWAEYQELIQQMPPATPDEQRWLARAIGDTAEQGPRMMNSIQRGAQMGLMTGLATAGAAKIAGLPLIAGPQAALGGAPAYALSVGGAFAYGYAHGQKVGSLSQLALGYAGGTFGEIMNNQGPNGERPDPQIAAAASMGAGVLASLTEMWAWSQIPGADKIIKSARTTALRNSLINGAFNNVYTNAVAKYGWGVGAGIVNELAQESAQVAMTELTKVIDQGVNDNEWDRYTADQVLERMGEIIQKSANSYAIMGLPGTTVNVLSGARAQIEQHRQEQLQTQAQRDAMIEAESRSVVNEIQSVDINERIAELDQREEQAYARASADPEAAVIEILQIEEERTDIERQRTAVAEQVVADETPAWQMTRDEYEATQQPGHQPRYWSQTSEAQRWQEQVKERFPDYTDREVNATLFLAEIAAGQQGVTPDAFLRTQFNDRIIATEAHTQQAREGMATTVQADIDQSLTPDQALQRVDQNVLGATVFQDGKALIHLLDTANRSTLIHEGGHIIRRSLAPDMQAQADQLYGVADGAWTRQQEEQFGLDWEEYIRTGEAPSETHRAIFQELARIMKQVYQAVVRGSDLTNEKRTFFDELINRAPLDPEDVAAQGGGRIVTADGTEVTQNETQVTSDGTRVPATTWRESQFPVVEMPLEEIQLSEEVQQFKEGADESGVVEPLEAGRYERLGTAPIVVWERTDGTREVITGRHRLDLARRSGEYTIPAQVVKETEGFTRDQALRFDAESNIRDGQGTVRDYAQYFRSTPMDFAAAQQQGLLSRAPGRQGFSIGSYAGDSLHALYRNGEIGAAKAAAIASAAPNNDAAQRVGIEARRRMNAEELHNFVRYAAEHTDIDPDQVDLFGSDDSAMQQAETLAKRAANATRAIKDEIAVLRKARSLSTEKARDTLRNVLGDVKFADDIEQHNAINRRIVTLGYALERMSGWVSDPDIMAWIRDGAEGENPVIAEAMESATESQDQNTLFQLAPEDTDVISRYIEELQGPDPVIQTMMDTEIDPEHTEVSRYRAEYIERRKQQTEKELEVLKKIQDQGSLEGIVMKKTGEERWQMAHRSTRKPGTWEISYFDYLPNVGNTVPVGHTEYSTFENMLREALNAVDTFDRITVVPDTWHTDPDILFQVSAWHGSPHLFDEFSLQHIGSGEGAQAFGWGLYFTENEGVARDYATELALNPDQNTMEGVRVRTPFWDVEYYERTNEGWVSEAGDLDPDSIEAAAMNMLAGIELPERFADRADEVQRFIVQEELDVMGNRNLYRVTLNESRDDRWLEWSEPVADQVLADIFPDKIEALRAYNALEEKLTALMNEGNLDSEEWNATQAAATDIRKANPGISQLWQAQSEGRSLYDYLSTETGGAKAASQFLSDHGFTGIKYPVQGTTRTTYDKGANYVMFNDADVKIEERILFQMVGEKANLSDTQEANLVRAKQMIGNGVSQEQIKRETGWTRGSDNRWRFEIPTRNIKIRSGVMDTDGKYNGPLDRLIAAPSLFDAYPILRGLQVRARMALEATPRGMMEADSGLFDSPDPANDVRTGAVTVYAQAGNTDELINVVQNAVQNVIEKIESYEGETIGVSPGDIDARLGRTPAPAEDQMTLFQTADPPDSPKFKAWFGDSKVVDESGTPLRVYHGTRANIKQFEHTSWGDVGFHFGTIDAATARLEGTRGYSLIPGKGVASETGESIIPAYLSIQNPLRVTDPGLFTVADPGDNVFAIELRKLGVMVREGDNNKELRQAIIDAGYDGMVYENEQEGGESYVALSPSQIKSINNRGTWDPADERILFQTDLAAYHGTTEEKLTKALDLGGMPMPSIAIRPAEYGYSDFGTITLIGDRNMIDPKADRANEVYSGDAYTPRTQTTHWDMRREALYELGKQLDQIRDEAEPDRLQSRSTALYASDIDQYASPSDLSERLDNHAGMQTMWLRQEKGKAYELPTKTREIPADKAEYGWQVKRWTAAREENGLPAREYTFERWQQENNVEPVEMITITELDTDAHRTSFEQYQDEYRLWLKEYTKGYFKNPRIDLGNRRVPATLANFVKAMKKAGSIGAEDAVMFGPAQARAQASRQLKSIDEIKEHAENVVENGDSTQYWDEIVKPMSDTYRELAVELNDRVVSYGDDAGIGVRMDAGQDAYRAVGEYLSGGQVQQRPERMAKALEGNGFAVTDELLYTALEFAHTLADAPVKYLEAKPRRAVMMDEFKAAVIPASTTPAMKDRLHDHGIRLYEYTDDADRKAKTAQAIADQPDVLFQEDDPGGAQQNIGHEQMVERAVAGGRFVPDHVLKDYATRPWAIEELEYRQSLSDEARQFQTAGEFAEYMDAMDMEPRPAEYYHDLYNGAPKLSYAEQNRKWVDSLDQTAIQSYLLEAAMRDEVESLPHPILQTGAKRLRSGKNLSEAYTKKIVDQIRDNPGVYRELFAGIMKDDEALQQIELERIMDPTAGEIEKLREANRNLRSRNKNLDEAYDKITEQIESHKAWLRHEEERTLAAMQEIKALESVIKSAQEEAPAATKQAVSPYADAIKSAKKEARQSELQQKRRMLAESNERIASVKQEMREIYRYRAQVQRQIKRILSPPASTIDYHFAKQIQERQAAVRVGSISQERHQRMQGLMNDIGNAEIRKIIDSELQRQDLKKMTPKSLDALDQEIEQLRIEGRRIRQEKLAQEKMLRRDAAQSVIESITQGKGLEAIERFGSRETRKKLEKGKISKVLLNTLRPERLWRALDGGEQGAVYKWLWQEVNRSTDAELNQTLKRIDTGETKMRQLGIAPKDLGRIINIDKHSYTVDEVIHMYVAMQDKQNAAALVHGNKIPLAVVNQYISQLTSEQKRWGDWMVESFGQDNFDRIQEVLIDTENRGMAKVARYFPMLRQDHYDDFASEVADSILRTTWAGRSGVNKKFTLGRINIAAQNQRPIRLGATAIWRDQTAKQEKYIASAHLVRRLRGVFGDKEVQRALVENYGTEAKRIIDKYINDFTNPNIYANQDGFSRTMRILRNHYSAAVLAYNATTVLKQLPSSLLYLSEVGPLHLAASWGKFLANPMKMVREVEGRDPQVKARSMNRFMEEIKLADKSRYEKIVSQVGNAGFLAIAAADKMAVTIGWKAVYDAKISQGLSEAGAIEAAQTATLRTQPAGRAKDLAAIYRTDSGLNWFLMFSNQLNQIFNLTVYDLPNSIKRGEAARAFGIISGVSMNAVAMGVIARKKLWDDESEPEERAGQVGVDLLQQIVSSVPVVGGSIVSGAQGYGFMRGVDPFPMAHEIGALTRALSDGAIDMSDVKSTIRLLEAAGTMAGLPVVAQRRLRNMLLDDDLQFDGLDPWELLGGAPEE